MTAIQSCGGCTKGLSAKSRTLLVRETADLSLLHHWFRRYDSIRLHIAHLSAEENAKWETALENAYMECGCTLGAYCLVAAIGVSLVLLVSAIVRSSTHPTSLAPFLVEFIVASVIAGKCAGIVAGRIRVPILLARLRNRMREIGGDRCDRCGREMSSSGSAFDRPQFFLPKLCKVNDQTLGHRPISSVGMSFDPHNAKE